MARAIDADDLKRAVESFAGMLSPAGGFLVRQDAVLRAIELAPTIEAEPVKQGWISVKDRPPEVEERVLVYSYEDGINFGYFLGYEDGFFIDCVYPNEPTHWMPLPEPPERGGK